MPKQVNWVGNHLEITPPSRTKKVTGTRFATILGLNPWSTPFEMWCAITKTYEKPFEDTIYTVAGKTIEPKQADYIETLGLDIVRPVDVYGDNYFQKTYGDFYPENPIFGGMWDYLGLDEKGNVDTIFEMKTTKRVEDWEEDIPEYYALQAALYAYLKGVDTVVMVASFLDDKDYPVETADGKFNTKNTEKFTPNVTNTITKVFELSVRYPNFEEDYIKPVENWWNDYVVTGISPDYDEKKDREILEALRKNDIKADSSDIESIVKEAGELKKEIDELSKVISPKEKKLKALNDKIKNYGIENFRDGDKKVEVKGDKYTWTISRGERVTINKDKLEEDGLLNKYSTSEVSYRLTVK